MSRVNLINESERDVELNLFAFLKIRRQCQRRLDEITDYAYSLLVTDDREEVSQATKNFIDTKIHNEQVIIDSCERGIKIYAS